MKNETVIAVALNAWLYSLLNVSINFSKHNCKKPEGMNKRKMGQNNVLQSVSKSGSDKKKL